jgi:type I restriction enzyme M protein
MSVPLPNKVPLPLPIGYKGANGKEPDNEELVALIRTRWDNYFAREVRPHWPDAWIDYSKTRVGYEITINRHFYVYEAPRALQDIRDDIKKLEDEIMLLLKEVA